MIKNNEKRILQIIKYAPIVFIILLSMLITYLLLLNNQNYYKKEIRKIETTFTQQSKEEIQLEVKKFYQYIMYQKNKSEDELRKELKNRVDEAYTIAYNIYLENKTKDKTVILKMIKDALRQIRFNNGRGYYFIHDIKGNNLLYPLNENLENKNYLHLKDTNGYNFVKKIINTIKNKTETFDTYYWSKPKKEKERIYKKISFYKYFKPLNISIGTGEYLSDFENSIKEDILKYINKINKLNERYLFVINYNAKVLGHKNLKKLKKNYEIKNKELFKKIVNLAKKKEHGFLTYKEHMTSNKLKEKTSYIINIPQWKWIIGMGYYKTKLEKLIQQKKQEALKYKKVYITNILLISFSITVILLIISAYMSNIIKRIFIEYKQKVYEEITKNRQKDTLLTQQSKMATMGEMIGNIAHQWRQPLSLISTAASGIKVQKEFGVLNDKEFNSDIKIIIDATLHLSRTIDDFKNFFKPNKNKTTFTTSSILEKSISLVSTQFKSKNIKLIKKIENVELTQLENELIQVLINILNNARDQLMIKNIENKIIYIQTYKKQNNIIFSIKDNAGGIKLKIMEKIFDAYFTTKKNDNGTGIGLYMSKEIIEKHMNGEILVENSMFEANNKKYYGANFIIKIPLT
ncbi:cache domain-containing protein [Arcobacter sp. CECT 8985]|uniref:sensor histidine kinase n=1 Tax=Arcobacter sp. CECT 8985 TaxID=1935424 RepID=UPI00100A5FC3|nr:cache domain-containing protein [Arcobacter sp. CECT 8985]RXJ86157.1 histidine kinase [Arcobacter sp. CECT 8985]